MTEDTHPEYGEPILKATPKNGGETVTIYGEHNAEQLRDDPEFKIEELRDEDKQLKQ